ncbi:MAG: ABC transporter permease [Acidobacteriaceae bacterium]
MLADFRFAWRQLRRAPGYTLTAVLTLALGIGANAAIFTLVDSILLRPLPYPQQNRLMRLGYGTESAVEAPFPKGWIRALNRQSASFAAISGFGPNAQSNIGDEGSPERVFGSQVMVNAPETLGIHPALGRFFTPDDSQAGHDPVVVLGYGYWQQHFAADPDVIGHMLRIDGISRRIIGVMPSGVRFPYADTEFLTPVTFRGGDPIDAWNNFDLRAFGRLKPGVTAAQAQGELRRLQKVLLPMFPWIMPSEWAADTVVVPMLESEVGAVRPRLMLLFAAAGLVLLVACANVANLMLARASGREREIAVRGALGASAGRLVRQLLTESMVLGGLAGIVGVMAAAASLRLVVTLLPADTPRLANVALEWPVFVFGAAASVVTGILFGLIPALKIASPNLCESLHAGGRSVAGKAGRFGVSIALVTGQVALSVVVIAAAGLMLHSLWSLSQVNPGFRTDRIVTAQVSLNASDCPSPHLTPGAGPTGRCQEFFTTLLDRLRGLPGEENVALTDTLPLAGRYGSYAYDVEGRPRSPRQEPQLATQRIVSPGYFATLGTSLLRGRLLNAQDASGASRAVIIDEHMAERLWPHKDPLGQHLLNVVDETTPAEWMPSLASVVVGVVSNSRDGSLASAFVDEVYLPMTAANEKPVMYVLLRTHATAEQAASQLRQAVAAMDPQAPVTDVRSLNEVVAASESGSRSLAILLLVFGAVALVIGGVGVYSLIACIVSWRTREIGIRLALGAQRGQIVASVVRQSLLLALGGCATGLVGAALAAQLLRRFLFGVKTIDPVTFCAVPVLMMALALAAAWIPARRAASVDPIETLRME